MANLKRANVMQKVEEACERLRASTGIEYRPVKKLSKWSDGYGKVIEYPSPKMIEKMYEEDLFETANGKYDKTNFCDLFCPNFW